MNHIHDVGFCDWLLSFDTMSQALASWLLCCSGNMPTSSPLSGPLHGLFPILGMLFLFLPLCPLPTSFFAPLESWLKCSHWRNVLHLTVLSGSLWLLSVTDDTLSSSLQSVTIFCLPKYLSLTWARIKVRRVRHSSRVPNLRRCQIPEFLFSLWLPYGLAQHHYWCCLSDSLLFNRGGVFALILIF